jgi:hypothetical protein
VQRDDVQRGEGQRGEGQRGGAGRREDYRRDENRIPPAPRAAGYEPVRERPADEPLPLIDELEDIFTEDSDLDAELPAARPAPAPPEGRSRDERDERGGRRRRRGRRGRSDEERGEARSARPAGSRPAATRPPVDELADDELDVDMIVGDYSPSTRAAAGRDKHESEDDLDLDREGGHPVHKKIPTWDEAIGVLVDANMASRANHPDRPHRGRGRGRGGR